MLVFYYFSKSNGYAKSFLKLFFSLFIILYLAVMNTKNPPTYFKYIIVRCIFVPGDLKCSCFISPNRRAKFWFILNVWLHIEKAKGAPYWAGALT